MNDETPSGPDPADRIQGMVSGTPVLLTDGREWLLADFAPDPGDVWDRLYDGNIVRGQYDASDLYVAAYRLLRANYHLTPEEAYRLLAVDPANLVHPVEVALFGVDRPYRGFSEWVEVSLLANGLDPDRIPPSRRRAVVDYLVTTGKAIPAAEYLSSHQAAAKRKAILDFAARRAARRQSQD